MALGLFAQIGLLAHLFSLLVPAIGAQWAGIAMGGATAAAIAGRTLVGWLMPAGADRRLVASASYAVQIIGSIIFVIAAGTNIPLLILGVILFGAGIGNATSLPPLIAQTEFVKDDVSRVVPLIVAIAQASFAFAPVTFGLIIEFAARGGYGIGRRRACAVHRRGVYSGHGDRGLFDRPPRAPERRERLTRVNLARDFTPYRTHFLSNAP